MAPQTENKSSAFITINLLTYIVSTDLSLQNAIINETKSLISKGTEKIPSHQVGRMV